RSRACRLGHVLVTPRFPCLAPEPARTSRRDMSDSDTRWARCPPQPALLHGAPRVFRHGVGTITFGAWHRLFVPHMSDAGLDGGLMNVLREAPQDGRVCFWWHSVPKVEYMTRPPRSTLEDIPRRRLHPLPRPEQNRGIEVPLHAAIVANLAPPAVE